MAYNRRAHGRRDDSAGVTSTNTTSKKAEKQKWYDESRKPGDHNAKYLSKLKDMKEQLQREEFNGASSMGKGDHSRHRSHPPTRPGLTRHFSVNLPVFVTSADFSSVPRAGRLSMYAKPGKHMPAIHPIQGVGLLDDHGSRKGLKRTEQNTKRHNSLTPLEKVSQSTDRGSQPPTMKRFARSQKSVQPSFTHLHRNAADSAPSVTSVHVPRIGRLRSRSTTNEYDVGVSSTHAHSHPQTRTTDKHGGVIKGKPSKYKTDHSNLREGSSSRKVAGLELAPVKRSIKVNVPTSNNDGEELDHDIAGYRAPVSTPLTTTSGSHSDTTSIRSGLHRDSTPDSDDWSEVGVTLSQIRLSHSQSEPSIQDYVASMAREEATEVDLPRVHVREHQRARGRSLGSEDGIPILQINSQSEAETKAQLENTVTISAPFIMFRPATPRMPEREEKTQDSEIGRVLVKAATQAETRRKEMRRLLEDINDFNSANKNLYRKVKVHPLTS